MPTPSFGDLATVPSTATIMTIETINCVIDTALRLAPGITNPVSPTSQLVKSGDVLQPNSDAALVLADSPTVSGTTIVQKIRGSQLVPNATYSLVVSFGDGAGNTQATALKITCPF